MTREFSTYLNLLRLLAALAVFLGHCGWLWTPGWSGAFAAHGWVVPVLVFFVLSGFVIGHTVAHQDGGPGAYAVNRAARIYSVALPALVATFILDAIGRHVAPALYGSAWGYTALHPARQFLRSLLFVNEIWWSRSMPGSNGPFWSLAYEVWYYVAFGVLAFGRGPLRLPATALVLGFAGPWVTLLFPIWLLGLGAHRLAEKGRIGPRAGWALAVGGLMLAVALEGWATRSGLRHPPMPLFAHRREIGLDYAIGLAVAAHLLGMQAVAPRLARLLGALRRPVNWAAGASFTLYLFHFPVAQCLAAISPWPLGSQQSAILIVGGTLVVVLAAAELTERRKEPWRRLFATLLRIGTRRSRPMRSSARAREAASPSAEGEAVVAVRLTG